MIDEIMPGLYRVAIPLPRNPLQSINSYIIKGRRNLMIDTGMNRPDCYDVVAEACRRLDVSLEETDIFVTHHHADHMGLVARLATSTSSIIINSYEANSVLSNDGWMRLVQTYRHNGFPETELQEAFSAHPGRRYQLDRPITFRSIQDGDSVEAGRYRFTVLITPGHTARHSCLYEPDRKLLVSGDHILFDITPNITAGEDCRDALGEYLTSLRRTSTIDVNLVLPGHRSVGTAHRKRIYELERHHEIRACEVLEALQNGPRNAYQVAPFIHWDIDCSSWNQFPPQQKWFAVGETIAHLRYLEELGKVKKKVENGIMFFLLADASS
jgi:glyoxylase-like metal-dependent hydrolase (beta-lactamase superfamily II)